MDTHDPLSMPADPLAPLETFVMTGPEAVWPRRKHPIDAKISASTRELVMPISVTRCIAPGICFRAE